jgi:F-type H+-transporting ATPase subunit gamma
VASQQDIKRRIRSVGNTRKITKALELVASAKLRRAQVRIEALRPYADRTRDLTMEAVARANVHGEPLLAEREPNTVAILAVTGDRGLSGAFNVQIIRRVTALAREHESHGRKVRWLAVGRKGAGTLRFRRLDVVRSWQGFTDQPTYTDAAAIAAWIIDRYREADLDRVEMVYNHFQSALSQTVEVETLFPVPEGRYSELSPRERALEGELLFEPEAQDMLGDLLRTATEVAIFRALLESAASKHGAQMTAMGNAAKNAEEVISDLTLAMNRARQAEITQEILEVVAGADALE